MPRIYDEPLPLKLKPYWADADCTLYHGDCLKVMPQLPEKSVHLAFCDPPFNINHKYDYYEDKVPLHQYMTWTRVWLAHLHRLLRNDGSIWVAIGAELQDRVKGAMEAVGFHWRQTVIWHYTFGPRQEGKLTPSWVALHHMTKSDTKWTWNKQAVRVPSARQLKYRDHRAQLNGKLPDNVWVLLPEECESCFSPTGDVWLASRVCGTFKERTNHPAQMPEKVLERIIRLCSNEGDVVLDPMLGSGTTLAVGKRLRRRGVGIELSETYLRECCISRLE